MENRVEMIVRDADGCQLRYRFATFAEASQMMTFLRDVLAEATFVIQPQRH